jgi:U3 small nucleolar RNA-associated protein 10
MPSLSEQLSQFTHKKRTPSLLYAFKVATDLDLDAILNVALSGLEELCIDEPSLSDFSHLFSMSLTPYPQMSHEERETFSKDLKSFLRQLSPLFLKMASLKVLEWLIRRHLIHVHFVDDIVECILPFHESKQFVTTVFVLELRFVFKQHLMCLDPTVYFIS